MGLQRVVGDEIETLVTDGVVWAADDRAGGVLFTYDPTGPVQSIWRIPAGSTEAVLVAADVDPFGDPIVVDGATLVPAVRPVYPRDQPPPPGPLECDYDAYQHGYVDIDTGEMLVLDDCVGLEERGPLPTTAVDTLALHVEGPGTWPDETDLGAPSYRFAEPITGEPIDVPGNPYPDPCYACTLGPELAPDARTLLVIEWIPEPADLGLETWDDIETMTYEQRWAARDAVDPATVTDLRVVDLESGKTLALQPLGRSPHGDSDFDGRHAVIVSQPGTAPTTSIIVDLLGDTEPIVEEGWHVALLHPDTPS